jgi:hypothetical protein
VNDRLIVQRIRSAALSSVVDLADGVGTPKLTAIKAPRYRGALFYRASTTIPHYELADVEAIVRQSHGQSPSVSKPSQQLWTSAACPTVYHDAHGGCEVSSSGRSSLSPSCVGIMAAAGGIAVANLYHSQPMLPDVGIQAAMNGNQSTVLSLAPQATSRTNTIYIVLLMALWALTRGFWRSDPH